MAAGYVLHGSAIDLPLLTTHISSAHEDDRIMCVRTRASSCTDLRHYLVTVVENSTGTCVVYITVVLGVEQSRGLV